MMSDKQGKGPYSNDGRVEKNTSRASETGNAGSKYSTEKVNKAITDVKDQTRDKIKKRLS
jgi:hypothetical protein